MTLHDLLPILILFLGATAICILFFDRIGLGSIVGFIGAGVLIGPHTPGPVAELRYIRPRDRAYRSNAWRLVSSGT
jgi:Kef-type K+ transport system membrane component KefB